MKKKRWIVGAIIAVAVIVARGVIGTYVYRLQHPKVSFGVSHGHGMERVLFTVGGPISQKNENKLVEFHTWNDLVITELAREAQQPRDIQVSAEVKDGKTTFRYEGTYTTKDGETVEYFEEKTFDFVFDLDEELLED